MISPRWLALLLSLLAMSLPIAAQVAPPPAEVPVAPAAPEPEVASEPEVAPPDVAAAEARLEEVKADEAIDDALKAVLLPKYQQAVALRKEASEFASNASMFRMALETAPGEVEQLKAELAALPIADQVTAAAPPALETDGLQDELETRRLAAGKLSDELEAVGKQLALLLERPAEISERLPEAQRELAEARKKLAADAAAATGEVSAGKAADLEVLEATVARLENEVAMLTQEKLGGLARTERLQAQRELLTRKEENANVAFETLKKQVNQRLTRDAERLRLEAEQSQGGVLPGDKVTADLAEEVRGLALEFEEVVEELKTTSADQADLSARRRSLNERYEVIKGQLDLGDSGRSMAQVVLDLRRSLPGKRAMQSVLDGMDRDLAEVRLAAFRVDDELRAQRKLEQEAGSSPPQPVARLLASRADLLAKLTDQYGNLLRSRATLRGDEQRFVDRVSEVRDVLEKRFFWMRSSPPIGLNTITELPKSAVWLFGGELRGKIALAWLRELPRYPMFSAFIALAVIALFGSRRKIVRALEGTGMATRRISTDRYRHTMKALLYTVLLALPVPMLIFHSGWLLWRNPDPAARTQSLGFGLLTGGLMVFWLWFLAAACRPGGLGGAHFRWPEEAMRRLRRVLFVFAAIYIPSQLMVILCFYSSEASYFDGLGRVLFIAAHLGWAWLVWRQCRSSSVLVESFVSVEDPQALMRWRFLWFPLFLISPLLLALLAAGGYVITAFSLSIELFMTMSVCAGAILAYRLTLRWFNIRERKLALEQAREQRRARREAAAAGAEERGGSEELLAGDIEEEELDLESIGDQARHLLLSLFAAGAALALALLWSRTIPFLEPFETVRPIFGLNVLQLAKLVLVAVLAVIAVKNLPGFLELAVLRKTGLDRGARYAIATLSRYAVVAVAVLILLETLQMDWAKLSWIAAALGVGLGFGLQEVVANFVCGLIILFERPVRIGDVITIEGITGTVTKIRIRATEITDWDRKEFVIPNKSLVTGTLLNWTLSSPVNRVVIPVGVAYGCDTGKAQQILLDVAHDHPIVLEEPTPVASFEGFGDSSLNLGLRVFLPDLENRLKTTTELHAEIDKRFAAEGIEIPFPQRDMHIRSGSLPVAEKEQG